MDNSDGMKVKRNDGAVWRVIDGEIVVLIPEEAALHALMGCGSRIWELIEGETTISEIVQRICAEYEVEPQKARLEITEFVMNLADKKLLEVVPVTSLEASR